MSATLRCRAVLGTSAPGSTLRGWPQQTTFAGSRWPCRRPSRARKDLRAADPEFFTTAHHNGYPAVLVRLAAVDVDELAELLTDGWRCQAPKPLVKEFENLPSR
ncbi:MAG: hypothetical protein H0U09_05790 [Geodermatophilaceae bacterium]|nr:hypothetical protein [Geodermatophilaceae bacterium]